MHQFFRQSGGYAAAACTSLALGLLFARGAIFHSLELRFMVWNLFLAWLPWLLAIPVRLVPSRRGKAWQLLPVFAAWFLFLPNAPYMVTDLLHLRHTRHAPVWFDASMLFVFAWTGCVLGFASLRTVHERIENWLGRTAGWAFVASAAVGTGFGIYLGRFLRWNTWDVLTRPRGLAFDVAVRVLRPEEHAHTWGVTLLFAALMLVGYASMRPAEQRVTRQ